MEKVATRSFLWSLRSGTLWTPIGRNWRRFHENGGFVTPCQFVDFIKQTQTDFATFLIFFHVTQTIRRVIISRPNGGYIVLLATHLNMLTHIPPLVLQLTAATFPPPPPCQMHFPTANRIRMHGLLLIIIVLYYRNICEKRFHYTVAVKFRSAYIGPLWRSDMLFMNIGLQHSAVIRNKMKHNCGLHISKT